MRKCSFLISACAFTLIGVSSAFAALPTPAYVDTKNGSDSNTGTGCAFATPCATLNAALSISGAGSVIIVLGGGLFGPIVLTGGVYILGSSPNEEVNIVSDPTADVGCLGHLPGSCGLTNNGYAVEVKVPAATPDSNVTILHVAMRANGGSGALKMSSGSSLNLNYDSFDGGGSGAAVQLNPNNLGNGSSTVYLANSEIRGSDGTANSGAVEVKPSGNTSVQLHFNRVQVHNSAYGIRTDGSLLSGPSFVVNTSVSNSEFFALQFAAVNAFTTAGTGQVVATFDSTKILNTGTGLKANGAQSIVTITNNTVTGNVIGLQQQNSATIYSPGNNIINTNGTNLIGTLTSLAPM